MSRPRFLADHDLKFEIIERTTRRQPAIDFARLLDIGLETHPDEEVLRFAAQERRILVSHDVNTMAAVAKQLLLGRNSMHGLLLIHQNRAVAPAIDDLLLIWTASEAEEWIGRIEFLPL